ncbi:MAG: hypothetical protein NUV32_09345 [Exilispira sp.]|nr:hypothetical protein [Exilispira sp.]
MKNIKIYVYGVEELKKYIFFLLLIFSILLISCVNKNENIKFSIETKANNIIVYNVNIRKEIISNFLEYYDKIIDKSLLDNELYKNSILQEDIVIIILNKSFEEIKNIKPKTLRKVQKKRKNKLPILSKNIIYNLGITEDSYLNGIFQRLNDVIIIRLDFLNDLNDLNKISTILCFMALSEYNHYIVSKNLLRNFGNSYSDYILKSKFDFELSKIKLFDESITHFYFYYYYTFIESKIINEAKIILNKELTFDPFYILGFYKQFLNTYFKKEEIGELKQFLYGDLSFKSSVVYYMYFPILIIEKYGIDKLKKFINFIYYGKYSSVDELLKINFNVDENTFYNIWTDSVKK